MAVYTESATRSCGAFSPATRSAALVALKGIAEGVENSNYLLSTERGQFILTLYEKRVEPADLPFFLGADGASGARAASPARCRSRHATAQRCAGSPARPAAIVTFLDGMSVRAADAPSIADARRRGAGALHLAGRRLRAHAPNALSVAGWRPLFEACRGARRHGRCRVSRDEIDGELDASRAAWPRGAAAGRDPCRSVPRQRLLPRTSGFGPDRLLFRLQRPARLRRRDLPQRLVLRGRPRLQRHQGAGAAARLPACGRSTRAELEALPMLAAARRCASCSPGSTTG